tara:strand:+ start:20 stop:553 length:534 start_codon:yes stop_codon:yes gene_type:complete
MKKIRLNAKRGILFWVTGLSGSGKSSIAEKIWPRIKKKFGPTLLVNGDNMRQIFNLKKYDRKSRLENAINFSKFSEYVTNQGINIIFANIGMFHKARNRNRVKIENYIEVFIDAKLNDIVKKGEKRIYRKKQNNIVGKDIVAQLPKKPNITLKNDFTKSIKQISKELINKINEITEK